MMEEGVGGRMMEEPEGSRARGDGERELAEVLV